MEKKLKSFNCDIHISFTNNNNIKAYTKEEYLKMLREQFLDDYGIVLQDDHIKNLTIEG